MHIPTSGFFRLLLPILVFSLSAWAAPAPPAGDAPVQELAAPQPASAPGLSVQVGPSVPMVLYRPGAAQVELLPGAGIQWTLGHPFFEREMGGSRWQLLTLQLMAFGSLVRPGAEEFGALSVAGGACTLSSLVCLVAGRTVLSTAPVRSAPWFLGLSLGTNVLTGPPADAAIPGLSSMAPTSKPPAANTVRF